MTRLVLAGLAVLAIIYTVPILVYAAFASFWGMAVPPGSVTIFLTGILLSKAGTAAAFVGLYALARPRLGRRWIPYAALWYAMFIAGEIGQAMGPGYTWREALAGGISETVYVPLAAWITARVAASSASFLSKPTSSHSAVRSSRFACLGTLAPGRVP